MNHVGNARSKSWRATSPLELKGFYDAIFSQPDLAVYVIRVCDDGTFRIDDANAAVAKLASRPVGEICGLTPRECLIEPIADCLETNLRICLETETSLQYERELDLPEGRLAWKTTLIPTARHGGEPVHVVGITRDISYEARMASVAEHHEALLKGLGSTLPNIIYLYDLKTQRVCFTAGAESRPLGYRSQQFIEMGNELVPLLVHPDDQDRVGEHLKDLARLKDGEISSIEYRVRHLDGRYRHFLSRDTVFNRDDEGGVELILGVSEDVTEQDRMQEEVRDLSERLLMLQIEERRVIAQELHDSTAQHLIAADLALERIREVGARGAGGRDDPRFIETALDDAQQSLQEAKREIRVQTFLLHPPLLQSRGLGDAVETFATGFAARAGLEIEAHIDRRADRVSDEFAVALFRVCQEALTNVYRHARASKVVVILTLEGGELSLTVLDNGIGSGQGAWTTGPGRGVGLAGMRERMERLGGVISVEAGHPGTKLIAKAPLIAKRPRRTVAPQTPSLES